MAPRGSFRREMSSSKGERKPCLSRGVYLSTLLQTDSASLHAWHNRSDQWARMVFVLTAAKPLVVNGQKMENAMFKD
jgi:hypothetical protein